jgi:hypothetical protein
MVLALLHANFLVLVLLTNSVTAPSSLTRTVVLFHLKSQHLVMPFLAQFTVS